MEKIRGFEICKGYEEYNITLPKRQTKHAVGYDFEAPEDITVPSIWKTIFANAAKFFKGQTDFEDVKPTLIKTGVKAYFQPDEVMIIANRSSGPVKKGLVLGNGIGIFECDYYSNPTNDGNIIFGYFNFFPVDVQIKKGEAIGQAYFQKFLCVDNDFAEGERLGGFGSTDKK